MVVIFQKETGGLIYFSVDSTLPVVYISGYVDVVGQARLVSRFSGTLVSGVLTITKSGISSLRPGYYTLLPQVLDDMGKKYFLALEDLQIVEVPE